MLFDDENDIKKRIELYYKSVDDEHQIKWSLTVRSVSTLQD